MSTVQSSTLEIVSPRSGAALSSPLVLVCVRYEGVTERSALVKDLAADGRARAGSDCAGCPFIAGCPQFRSAS
jgi:hypothetical protein